MSLSELKKSLFATGSVDNAFHGTMISHTEGPTNDFDGIDRNRVLINADPSKRKTVSNLPEAYTSIQPYMDYFVSVGCTVSKPQSDVVTKNMKCEYQ